jgi:hypothetical protein
MTVHAPTNVHSGHDSFVSASPISISQTPSAPKTRKASTGLAARRANRRPLVTICEMPEALGRRQIHPPKLDRSRPGGTWGDGREVAELSWLTPATCSRSKFSG